MIISSIENTLSIILVKKNLVAAVTEPVVSGGMVVLQEMGMAAMALDRERTENPEPNAN